MTITNEEAIERLEGEKKCVVGACGEECKYWACHECHKVEWQDTQREAIDIAISALEKQIPKKPLIRYENMGFGISPNETFKIKGCPCCKEDIDEETSYCQNCGQLICWDLEGEEDDK